MSLSSNVLPSIRYATDAGSQLNINVSAVRNLSGRFRIRPKSQCHSKLINAALIQTNNTPQSFTIGGVRVLSEKLTRLSASTKVDNSTKSNEEDLRDSPSHTTDVQTYRLTNQSSSKVSHSIKLQNKPKSFVNQLTRGKHTVLHVKNGAKSHNKFKSRKRSSKHQLTLDNVSSSNKPDFTTSNTKATKVYLSQKQSADISNGLTKNESKSLQPSAPPCTPSLEMLQKFEYVPSLSDNLAKQQIKNKLKVMKKVETEKEKVKQADKMKVELKEAKEKEQELKKQQRRAIYALNSLMTKVENNQFERFKSEHGLRPKEYPSNTKAKKST